MHLADSLDTYLTLSGALFAIGTFGFLARRNAISMLMSIELMLNAVNLAIVAFGAFIPTLQGHGAGDRADGHGRRRGRGDRRARDRHRDLPQPQDAARRRVRRDAPMSFDADPRRPDHRPAAGRLPDHRRRRPAARASSAFWIPVGAVVASWAIAMLVIATFHDGEPFGERAASPSRSGTGSRPAQLQRRRPASSSTT